MKGKNAKAPTFEDVSTRLHGIAKLAREAPDMAFRTLAHHLDIELLREAYRRTRKSGATGVDRQTGIKYGENLEANLQSLLERLKAGTYRAPPVRRARIPKEDGKTREIGVPTFEDKVLQRAVAMILNAIYEQDFYDFSYGFRPARSAHQALEALWEHLMKLGGGWVLDVDIKAFFDTLDHAHLRSFLDQRVVDKVLRRLIGKWLNAGVFEEGSVMYPDEGTPQGGVISPLLANVYLHEVLDKWFVETVRPRLRGPAHLIRYADDFLVICALEADAKRVMEVLPQRLSRYGLTINTDKTKLVPFKRPSSVPMAAEKSAGQEADSFDLLGFTHMWRRSRDGRWIVGKKTSSARLTRAVKATSGWCRKNRHQPMHEQQRMLRLKLQGHYNYYGIRGNSEGISRFRWIVRRKWFYWLNRRSQRRRLTWNEFDALLKRHPLPPARLIKSAQTHPKQTLATRSRMREICTSGSVGGPGAHLFPRWVPPVSKQ